MGSAHRRSSYRTVSVLVIALCLGTGLLSEARGDDSCARNNAMTVKFCSSPVIRDYEAPLRSLPRLKGLPESGQLPFAPKSIQVSRMSLSSQRLALVGVLPGYQITNTDIHSSASLKWRVKIGVSRVVSNGSSLAPLSESVEVIDVMAPGSSIGLQAGIASAPGSYRVDISFLNDVGQALGAFAEYVRVVPLTLKVRLGLSQQTVRLGGVVKSRIENLGTMELGYGRGQILERFEQGDWVKLPQGHPVFQSLLVAGAGMAGRCQPVHVPAQAQPGRYRLRQMVFPLASKAGKRFPVFGYFKVLDRG